LEAGKTREWVKGSAATRIHEREEEKGGRETGWDGAR